MKYFDPTQCRNESEVESKFIVQYLLPELGYSLHDWHQEVALGNIRLDFLAFASQMLPFTLSAASPLSLVIEAKGPSQNLDVHVRRLQQYLTHLHTRYGLLTNGRELRIYEKIGSKFLLIFQCQGCEILDRIEEMKQIVGKEMMQERVRRNNISDTLSKQITEKKEVFQDMKIIAIYHNKGGVGKTTVSINLAAALRRKGHRVLLIDLDSQANSTFAGGLVKFQFEEDDNLKESNVFHVLKSADFDFIQDVARQSDFFNTPEIDIIPSHIGLIEGQTALNNIQVINSRLIKKLTREEGRYDFVIIDTPPSRDLYAKIAIVSAHFLIIPSDLKPFANQGLSSVRAFVNEIDELRETLGKLPIKIMGVLPSKISANAKSLEKTFPRQKSTIVNHYKFPVMDTVIFDRTVLSHCVNKTIPVGDLEIPDPKSIFDFADNNSIPAANQSAEEFERLAIEVLEKTENM